MYIRRYSNSINESGEKRTMANIGVVGIQWGDEGKGKIIDYLSTYADVIVRFQGEQMRVIRLSSVMKRLFSTLYHPVYFVKANTVLSATALFLIRKCLRRK